MWLVLVVALLTAFAPTSASWAWLPALDADPLDVAMDYLKAQPVEISARALIAHLPPEGHWRLANAKGEIVTVSGPLEWTRALATLLPNSEDPSLPQGRKSSLYLTAQAATANLNSLQDIPADLTLLVLTDQGPLPLSRRRIAGVERLLAQVRPTIWIALPSVAAFRETVWQVGRALPGGRAPDQLTPGLLVTGALRLVTLEPGGPRIIPSAPRVDPATKAVLSDAIEPTALAKALELLGGQTIVVIGRRQGDILSFRPKSGPDQSVLVSDLLRAAEHADVALVLIEVGQARQPGSRTWAFSRISISGLDAAMRAPTWADFFASLCADAQGCILRAREQGQDRIALDLRGVDDAFEPVGAGTGETSSTAQGDERAGGLGALIKDAVAEVTGDFPARRVELDTVSRQRRLELDKRFLPGLPATVTQIYGLLLGLGLSAFPRISRWWSAIWPAEQRADYGSFFGFGAARVVRDALLLAVFLPLAAVPAWMGQLIGFVNRKARGRTAKA